MLQTTSLPGRKICRTRPVVQALSRTGRVASLVAVFASTASASIWENNDWALIGEVDGSVTYDSNVFAFEDGEGDTIFGAKPALTFQRKGSASDISLTADANFRWFADLTDQNSTDPSLLFNFAYPNTGEAIIRQRARLGWRRLSYPDYSVGDRIRRTELFGGWDGILRDNGKTRIIARLNGNDTDYNDEAYQSDVTDYGAGIGLAWSRTGLFEYTVLANYQHSEYSDLRNSVGDASRNGYNLEIGARGEFTPKITGEASIGIGRNEYDGGIEGSDTNWSTGVNVTWSPVERRSITLNADRGTYFDALGRAYNRLDAGINLRQGMAGGFSANARAGFGEYDFTESGSLRKDQYVRLGAGLDYNLTGRFQAGLSFIWTDRSSDIERFEFDQYEISGRASWRF